MRNAFIILLLLLCSLNVTAQTPNYLDPSFGDTGTVVMPFDITPNGTDWSYLNIAFHANKIIAVGSTNKLATSSLGMIQFENNGIVDSSFGVDGRVIKRIGSGGSTSQLLIQPDGKILVSGDDYFNFYAFRFLPNGSIDSSFNEIGEVSFDNYKGFCKGATLQPDGKILLCGDVNSSNKVIVARINQNGIIDSTFGQFGKAIFSYGVYSCDLRAVTVRPSGEILACGSINNGGNINFLLLQIKANGDLDSTFGNDGAVYIDFGTSGFGYDLELLNDGNVIVAGRSVFGVGMMAKLDQTGNFLNTFGNNGKVITSMPNGDIAPNQIEIDVNGNIYLSGHIGKDVTDDDFYLLRYKPNGEVDTGFAQYGIETKLGSGVDRVRDMIIQPDGKILLAGVYEGSSINQGAIVRYLPFPVSVKEIKTSQYPIQLYPNPSNSTITVKDLPTDKGDYFITDIEGKQLLSDHKLLTIDQITIDVAELPSGIYTFHFLSENIHLTKQFFKL